MKYILIVLSGLVIFSQAMATYTQANQRRLFLEDKISEILGDQILDPGLYGYRQEYDEHLAILGPLKPLSLEQTDKKLLKNKIVFIGDVHGRPIEQNHFLRFLQKSKNRVIVLEWIPQELEAELAQYLNGKISLLDFARKLKSTDFWPFSLEGYLKILKEIKKQKLTVLLPETNKQDLSLQKRDLNIVRTIQAHEAKLPGSKYMVFYGVLHLLGTNHLHDRLQNLGWAPASLVTEAESLFWQIYQNNDRPPEGGIYMAENSIFVTFDVSPLEQLENKYQEALIYTVPEDFWD